MRPEEPPGGEALWTVVAAVLRESPRVPARVCVQLDGRSLEVEWAVAAETPAAAPLPGPPSAVERREDPAVHEVRAPLVGTFYRAPEPGAEPFVQVGDLVEEGQQIGIIEAMKLMNPIVADARGKVVEIVAGDGRPVEYGETLVLLAPAGEP